MKTEIQKPNIVRIAYHQEKGDPHYGSCMWAYFDFDLDLYMLNIQSVCGNASYRWAATPNSESFLHLMARCDDGYMFEKLFDKNYVDVEITMAAIRNYLDPDEDDFSTDNALNELEYLLMDCSSESAAQHILSDWNNDHDYFIDDIWEFLETDFTGNQKEIIEVFCKYVKPKIMEILTAAGDTKGLE